MVRRQFGGMGTGWRTCASAASLPGTSSLQLVSPFVITAVLCMQHLYAMLATASSPCQPCGIYNACHCNTFICYQQMTVSVCLVAIHCWISSKSCLTDKQIKNNADICCTSAALLRRHSITWNHQQAPWDCRSCCHSCCITA